MLIYRVEARILARVIQVIHSSSKVCHAMNNFCPGGPLVTANPDLYEVIGVVSFGVGCALADYPGVYARVSKQLEWIGANTEGSWNTCARCPPGETCESK